MVYKPPYEIVKAVNQAGLVKARMGSVKTLLMGFLAGAFIAFGGFLAIMVGGGVPGIQASNPGLQKFIFGAAFPVGLMLVIIADITQRTLKIFVFHCIAVCRFSCNTASRFNQCNFSLDFLPF